MPYADLNGARYFYQTQGTGEPLLLLHGFTGSLQNWSIHVPVFAERFQTITVDLLGHGRSDAPADPARYAMELVAVDLVKLLGQIAQAPANLLGYSMGGRLALFLALNHPETFKTLILESASPGLATIEERQSRAGQDGQLADDLERDGIEKFVDRWQSLPLFSSQESLPDSVRARLRQQRLNNNQVGLSGSLRGMGTGAQPSLWSRLPALQQPLLLLVGALDTKFVGLGQQMAELAGRAHLTVVPNVGHTVHLERPGAFQGLVMQFLAENS